VMRHRPLARSGRPAASVIVPPAAVREGIPSRRGLRPAAAGPNLASAPPCLSGSSSGSPSRSASPPGCSSCGR
jgi:hypothetical protein